MAAPSTPSQQQSSSALQFTILIGVTWLLLNVAFYFLSGTYWDGKRATAGMFADLQITDATVSSTRIAFGIYSGVVATTAIAALFQTRIVTHAIAFLAGAASLVAAYFAFDKGIVATLPVSLIVIGLLLPLLAWRSLLGSRAAWAFLLAMCFTLWLLFSFAAPKVRSQLDISLWTANIIPGVLAVAWIGLAMMRYEYREKM